MLWASIASGAQISATPSGTARSNAPAGLGRRTSLPRSAVRMSASYFMR
jgi:hypothetical protein